MHVGAAAARFAHRHVLQLHSPLGVLAGKPQRDAECIPHPGRTCTKSRSRPLALEPFQALCAVVDSIGVGYAESPEVQGNTSMPQSEDWLTLSATCAVVAFCGDRTPHFPPIVRRLAFESSGYE
jgi:hypothetical protein